MARQGNAETEGHGDAGTGGGSPRLPVSMSPRLSLGAGRGGAMAALAGLGIAVSAYLTSIHYGGSLALCTGLSGCEQVQTSAYSMVAGVPVALFGLLTYLALLGLSAWRIRAGVLTPAPVSLGLFGLALTGTLYSIYLTYLEFFIIEAVCPWCITSAVLIAAICGLAGWDLGVLGSLEALELDA